MFALVSVYDKLFNLYYKLKKGASPVKSQEVHNEMQDESADDVQEKKSRGGSGVLFFAFVVVVVIAALVIMSSNKSSISASSSPSRSVISSPRTENPVPVRNDAVQWQSPSRRNTRQVFPLSTTNEVRNFRGANTRKPN